jgi:hypothetical protein
MYASPIFPLIRPLFFPDGLMPQGCGAARSSGALHLNCPYDGVLATSSIRRIIKRATRRAGLDDAVARELSGHSMRIGAAQEWSLPSTPLLSCRQEGGNQPMSYCDMSSMRQPVNCMKGAGDLVVSFRCARNFSRFPDTPRRAAF